MAVVKINNVVYGQDDMGMRWAIPVDKIVSINEQQNGYNDPDTGEFIQASTVMVWFGQGFGGCKMNEDTMESVHEAVFGVEWPAAAPIQTWPPV